MGFDLIRKLKTLIAWLAVYNFEPPKTSYDNNRDKSELILALRTRTLLITSLTKKLQIYFIVICFLILLIVGYITVIYFSFTKNTINNYFDAYNSRVNFSNKPYIVDEYIVEKEIHIALSFIRDKDYEKGILFLYDIEGEEAEWLRSLCYIKLKNENKAKSSLRRIVRSKGCYSLSAQEILQKYYRQ